VLVVHHAKKGAGRVRAGQALRGSSEFHAWGDSNLYLRKQADDTLTLTVEHRAAPSMPTLTLELAKHAHAVALNVVERPMSPNPRRASVDERIIAALAGIEQPLPFAELRALCRTRSATVYDRLDALVAVGRLVKSPDGYHLADRGRLNGIASSKSR